MATDQTIIGKRLPRIDSWEKVTGEAIYTSDFKRPGMLTAKVLRSPIAHGKILNIDTSRAERLPGVKAVITGKDGPGVLFGVTDGPMDQLPLQPDRVRFVGDEVAAVAAVDEETALEALSLIKVEYEELPHIFDPEEAFSDDAIVIHEGKKRNVAKEYHRHFGNVEKVFAEGDYAFEDEFRTHNVSPCPMEPHGCVAEYSRAGKLTIWPSTQNPHPARERLAKVIGLPVSRVRVINNHIGGAFGSKIDIEPLEPITALLAMKAVKPVKLQFSREEYFIYTRTRHPMIIEQKTAVSKEGKLQGRQVTIITDNGAYTSHGHRVTSLAGNTPPVLYRNPNYKFDAYVVYTNKPYGGAYQGYGNPQSAFAQEAHFNRICAELGLDPVEFRLMNCTHAGDTTVSGAQVTSCELSECIRRAAEGIEWFTKRGHNDLGATDPKKRRVKRGVGMALVCHSASAIGLHGPVNFGEAIVKMAEDGSVTLFSGTAEMGQGLGTAICTVVGEELGIPLDQVKLVISDTEVTPPDLGVYATRGVFVSGNAAQRAACEVKEKLFQNAAELLETRAEDLESRDGFIYVKSNPDRKTSLAEIARACFYQRGASLVGTGQYSSEGKGLDPVTGYGNYCPTYIFGAQAVEVEVDGETGQVKVVKVVSAHDVGRLLNPLGAEGQVQGAISRGMGMALSEEMVMEDGKPLNATLLNYRVPSILEMPEIVPLFVEGNEPQGPFGAKGIAEPAQVPTAPAIQDALYDALGIRIQATPFTPKKVLQAIERRGRRDTKRSRPPMAPRTPAE
ncbi:MAG: xanthine dehydrogenase family protein molybdopterin-binding subunit [Nitrospinota bacterium]